MSNKLITPDMLDSLHGWLSECAEAGERCPGNQEICDRFGFNSIASAAKAVKRLEADGRIAVVRGRSTRQVTILETGAQTAPVRHMGRAKRTMMKTPPAPVIPLPRRKGPKGKQCQWIDGEPSADDSCKCLTETVEGKPYCPEHLERAYRKPEPGYMRASA